MSSTVSMYTHMAASKKFQVNILQGSGVGEKLLVFLLSRDLVSVTPLSNLHVLSLSNHTTALWENGYHNSEEPEVLTRQIICSRKSPQVTRTNHSNKNKGYNNGIAVGSCRNAYNLQSSYYETTMCYHFTHYLLNPYNL